MYTYVRLRNVRVLYSTAVIIVHYSS